MRIPRTYATPDTGHAVQQLLWSQRTTGNCTTDSCADLGHVVTARWPTKTHKDVTDLDVKARQQQLQPKLTAG